jgi:hypothetical protein
MFFKGDFGRNFWNIFFSPLVCGYDFLEYNFVELGRELNIVFVFCLILYASFVFVKDCCEL